MVAFKREGLIVKFGFNLIIPCFTYTLVKVWTLYEFNVFSSILIKIDIAVFHGRHQNYTSMHIN